MPELTVRPLALEDLTPAYAAALNDFAVVQWTLARHRSWTLDSAKAWIAQRQQTGHVLGAFLEGRHIGTACLFNYVHALRRAELSYMIWDKTCWGRGYGTALVQSACLAAEHLGILRLVADCAQANAASQVVLERCGFMRTRSGRRRSWRDWWGTASVFYARELRDA